MKIVSTQHGRLSLIAAMARNRVIGCENALPWRLPDDLKRFKRLTMGKPILMGRRTFESIGRALPGRRNLVLTRDPHFIAPGCCIIADIETAIAKAGDDELMVIGGAQIYRQTLAYAQRLYMTEVQAEIAGDTLFPDFERAHWQVLREESHPADAHHAFGYRFVDYQRA